MFKTMRIVGSLAVFGAFLAFAGPSLAQTENAIQPEATDQMQVPAADQATNVVKHHKKKHHVKKVEAQTGEVKQKHKIRHKKMKASAPSDTTTPVAQ